jgi:hypothetical protein
MKTETTPAARIAAGLALLVLAALVAATIGIIADLREVLPDHCRRATITAEGLAAYLEDCRARPGCAVRDWELETLEENRGRASALCRGLEQ